MGKANKTQFKNPSDVQGKLDLLVKQLQNEDLLTRYKALKELGEIKDINSVIYIVQVLSNHKEDNFLRQGAAFALGDFAFAPELQDNSAILDALLAALADENTLVRQGAVIALGNFVDERAFQPLLSALLYDADFDVSSYATVSLKKYGNVAFQMLEAALEDKDISARSNAIWALGQIGNEHALSALEKIKDHSLEINSYGAKLKDIAQLAINQIKDRYKSSVEQ